MSGQKHWVKITQWMCQSKLVMPKKRSKSASKTYIRTWTGFTVSAMSFESKTIRRITTQVHFWTSFVPMT